MSVRELKGWTGHHAKMARAAACRDAVADIVRIAVGFSPRETNAAELLAAYDFIRTATKSTLLRLLTDYRTQQWIDSIWSNIRDGHPGRGQNESPNNTLSFDFLKLLALAAGHMEKRKFHCLLHVCTELSLVLPGARIRAQLNGLHHDCINVATESNGRLLVQGAEVPIEPVPVLAGFELVFAAHDIGIWLPDGYEPLPETAAAWDLWGKTLESAMTLIGYDRYSADMVESLVSCLIPLRAPVSGAHLSVSLGSTPGLIALVLDATDFDVAEGLVHEADHQQHYIQTTLSPVWHGEVTQGSVYYSPWRHDPRPLEGLLAGASAFVAVSRFWAKLLIDAKSRIGRRKEIGQRATLAAQQSIEGTRIVRRHGSLTIEGNRLVSALERSCEETILALSTQAEWPDWSRHSRICRREHRRKWMANHGSDQDRF